MENEVREKIVCGALDLFISQGIKPVTMDKIASSLTMSKRTIYEYFENKEALVSACLLHFKEINEKETNRLRDGCNCSFSALLVSFRYTILMLRRINTNFIEDAKLMFPKRFEQARMSKEALCESFQTYIEKSQREGHIKSEYSAKVLAQLYYSMLFSLQEKGAYDLREQSISEILYTVCKVFFRGVATEEGYEMIKAYLEVEI